MALSAENLGGGCLRLISDADATVDDLLRRLSLLRDEIERAVWQKGPPWSSIAVVRYVAGEVLFLEKARRVVSKRCLPEDQVPALSLLGLKEYLADVPEAFGAAVIERALGLRDAWWRTWAYHQYEAGNRAPSAKDGIHPLSWTDYLGASRGPCDFGPYGPYPSKRGVPRPWFSMRVYPGNVPVHPEIYAPSVTINGLPWRGCVEVTVTREIASRRQKNKELGYSDEICPEELRDFFECARSVDDLDCNSGVETYKDPYPDARMWLVEEGWLVPQGRSGTEPPGFRTLFCGQSAQDVVVIGQPRWWLELCVAVVLARGEVLSRRERQQVVEDLAPKMRGRVDEQWLSDEECERIARPVARRMFNYLVESFRRPLSARSLGGTFKYGVRGTRKITIAHPSVTRAQRGAVERDGVEGAADFNADSPEDRAHLQGVCERVFAALSSERSCDMPAIASNAGIGLEDVTTAVTLLAQADLIVGDTLRGYRRVKR